MSPARDLAQVAQFGVECTKHEVTAPSQCVYNMQCTCILFYTHHVFTTRQTCNQSFYSDCKFYLKCNNYPCNFVVTLKKTLTLYSTSIIYIHSNQAKYYTKRSCEMWLPKKAVHELNVHKKEEGELREGRKEKRKWSTKNMYCMEGGRERPDKEK